jgi:hypothetical protein
LGHRTNRRIVGHERGRRGRRRPLDELANGLIPKVLARVGLGDRAQHPLPRMFPRQPENALNQADRADATGGQGGVGPLLERRTDA